MNSRIIRLLVSVCRWVWPVVLVVVLTAGVRTRDSWFPATREGIRFIIASFRQGNAGMSASSDSQLDDAQPRQAHAVRPGHSEATSLELSDSALRNLGLHDGLIRRIKLQTYRKMITVPATVVEQPGRTRVQVATPMTGAITHVHAVEGEAIQPGTLLFRIRLTHEDLVRAQTSLVQTLGELDVEENEIARLKKIPDSGAVAGRFLLEREYAREKLTALLEAQRESLRLHGLSESQVEEISNTRRLLGELQMFAPSPDDHSGDEIRLTKQRMQPSVVTVEQDRHDHEVSAAEANGIGPLILQELFVHKGQSVDAGETLCVLKDLRRLSIEGLAFESDIDVLRRTWHANWKVTALFDSTDSESGGVKDLDIAWLANEVDADSRTLKFYVDLPNQVIHDRQQPNGRFVDWNYFPGQRLTLQIPVEEWPDRIVLPVDAVARDGADCFVFRQDGNHFDQVPVHVEFRDQHSVVIAKDGTLFPDDAVASRGAHQMLLALRNKAGGAPDPHAGHDH